MLVCQNIIGSQAAAPALKFLFENNFLGFFKVLPRAKFFSALTRRVIERGLPWNNARAHKLFSPSPICGEEMRDCAEPSSEVMKNLFGDSARKDRDEFFGCQPIIFLSCDCPRIVEGKNTSRPEAQFMVRLRRVILLLPLKV